MDVTVGNYKLGLYPSCDRDRDWSSAVPLTNDHAAQKTYLSDDKRRSNEPDLHCVARQHPDKATMADRRASRTPKRVACEGLSSRNMPSRSIGDHMASPYNVCDEELTMIPMKLTMEKPRGTEVICGSTAADG